LVVYEIKYKKSALKGLRKAPPEVRKRIIGALKQIARHTDQFKGDWKPLKGSVFWRLRVGRYRAICSLDSGELTLLVLKIGVRGDIYK